MSPDIYSFLEQTSPLLILWSFVFTLIHSVRIVRRFRRGLGKISDNGAASILVENVKTASMSTATFDISLSHRYSVVVGLFK